MPSSRASAAPPPRVATASSRTSSRTSGSSSTSDPDRGSVRLTGLLRLVHPFPSILDGVVVAGVAMVAGAEPLTALRLGTSMTALQASIGSLNDLVDAPNDRIHQPHKPIPAGLVTPDVARVVAAAAAIVGLALAVPSGLGLVALALIGLAIGYAYDLRFKGTAWSWVPFAVGIPLLPVYGWYGAAGSLPWWFFIVVPMAALAGAAIALANARADVDGDRAAGIVTVATTLGPERSWVVGAGLWIVTAAVALGTLASGATLGSALVVLGAAVIAAGVALGWGSGRRRRQLAWEVQALGAAILAIGWVMAAVA